MNTDVVSQVEKALELAVLNIEFLDTAELETLKQFLTSAMKLIDRKVSQNVGHRKSHSRIADLGAAIARRSSLKIMDGENMNAGRKKKDRAIANLWDSMLEDFLYDQNKSVWRVELPPSTTFYSPSFLVNDCMLQLLVTPTYGIYLNSHDGRMCKGKWNIRIYSDKGEKIASGKFQETTFKEKVGKEFPIRAPIHALIVCTLKQFTSLEKRRESKELERKELEAFSHQYIESVSPEDYNVFPSLLGKDSKEGDHDGYSLTKKHAGQKSMSQDIEEFGDFEESYPETPDKPRTDTFAKNFLSKLVSTTKPLSPGLSSGQSSIVRPFNPILQSLGLTNTGTLHAEESPSSVMCVGAHSTSYGDIDTSFNKSSMSVLYTHGEEVLTKIEKGLFAGMWVNATVHGFIDELGVWQLGIPEHKRVGCPPKVYRSSELIYRKKPSSHILSAEEEEVGVRRTLLSLPDRPQHRQLESIYNTLPAMEDSDEEDEMSLRSPTATGDTFDTIISLEIDRRLSLLDTTSGVFNNTETNSSATYDDKFARKRENILREIVESERVYTKGLIKLHEEFFTPIFDGYLVPMTFEEKMVNNSRQIMDLHSKSFLPALEDCFKKGSGIPAMFTKFLDQFEIYHHYVSEYDHVMNLVESMRDSREKFKKFLYERERNQDSFYSYLILPVQRVPRYRLLLETLLKATPDGYPEHIDVIRALEGIKKLCSEINEHKREIERMTQLGQIQSQISGLPESLQSKKKGKKREYLDDCLFKEVQKGLKFRSKYRRLYLFSDVLIVTNRARCYKAYHPLQSIRVTQTSVNKFSLQFKTRGSEKPEIRTFMRNDNKELLSAFVQQLTQVKRTYVLSCISTESDDSDDSEIDEQSLRGRE